MKTVDRVTVLGPKPSTRTSYDAALIGPPGPRGLKGDAGPQGPPGTAVVSGGVGVVTAVQLTCDDNGTRTAHRIQVVKDDDVYTYGITQAQDPDAGDPTVMTLRCPDDETCHDLSIVKDGTAYALYVDQAISDTVTFQAAISFMCTGDNPPSFHHLMVRKDGLRYSVEPTQ